MVSPIVVFTDGAAKGNPGPGGWGVVIVTPAGEVTELGGRAAGTTTNNQMELTGAIEALTELRGVPGPLAIYTDSTYVIQGIRAWIHGWRKRGWKTATGGDVLNRDLWEQLDALVAARGRSDVEWHYVRGHAGIPGNERVDEIADGLAHGRAITLYRGPLLGYPLPILDLPSETSVPTRTSPAGGRGRAGGEAVFVSQRGGRRARAPRDLGRLRTPRQGPPRRAFQEGDESGRRGGDPAGVANQAGRHLTV